MSASSDSNKDDSSEESEDSVCIDTTSKFRRHKNSIVAATSPLPLLLRSRLGRHHSPCPTKFDLILEDDLDSDTVGSSVPIPDLLRNVVPCPKSLPGMMTLTPNLKTPRKKSVHFKVPVWEQINDEVEAIPVEKGRRPKKMKGVIKHMPASTIVVEEMKFDPMPKFAQVTEVGDTLFTNSQLVRWNLRWRRVRHKFIFTFMIFVIILFIFPIVKFFLIVT